jgi:hypothetical protein
MQEASDADISTKIISNSECVKRHLFMRYQAEAIAFLSEEFQTLSRASLSKLDPEREREQVITVSVCLCVYK